MATDTTTTPVFLESRYSYRSWGALIIVLSLGGLGVWVLFMTVTRLVEQPPAFGDLFPGILITALWLLGAFVPTVYLAWRMLWKPTINTRVDGAGIWIDSHLYPWQTIHWFWGKQQQRFQGRTVRLWFQERSRLSLDKMIPLVQALSVEEYEDLVEEMRPYLGERFPHVDLG